MPKVTPARNATARGTGEQANGAREQTRRLVLQQHRALVVPDDADLDKIAEALKPIVAKAKLVFSHVWVERGEFDGSVVQAVERYAGKPGTPDARVGTFKAPPARSMKGGVRYSQPPLPKVEREVL